MVQTRDSQDTAAEAADLIDEVRDSARVGQHAAADALRKFTRAVDDAIPEAVHPLRAKIIDAAIELAENLASAQYQFNKKLIRSADRALNTSDGDQK
ncbi:hypothetical protein [Arthrobacter sp. SLBN-53]|uniref:hypothetical protein n=1 Tax=Arthrobacter sp. SLBN-53 TaxID=2768412 RepID=UPI00114D95C3|nr:hypothetical protein [Arthrobacter sp. SLBN-53]TQK30751.1 hypothetical protein FBY28_3779 [Arthrobacter sp. SLBN-53]